MGKDYQSFVQRMYDYNFRMVPKHGFHKSVPNKQREICPEIADRVLGRTELTFLEKAGGQVCLRGAFTWEPWRLLLSVNILNADSPFLKLVLSLKLQGKNMGAGADQFGKDEILLQKPKDQQEDITCDLCSKLSGESNRKHLF